MPIPLSARSSCVEPFWAMEVMQRALELESDGIDIVHLAVGEPDFPPPPEAVEACQRALADGPARYTDARGVLALREAIAADTAARTGIAVDPDRILVTNGSSPAMVVVFTLLCEPGDEVILPSPHYACYPNIVRAIGGVPVTVETRPEDGYAIDVDAVRAVVGPRTRAIVTGSPANPTGAVQSAETMHALAALGIPIVSDEIYDGLLYDGATTCSGLTLDGDVFVLDGFSKRYAMTGFRLGYVIAPEAVIRPLQSVAQNFFISTTSFVQEAGIAALKYGGQTTAAMVDAYTSRRKRMIDGVRGLGFDVPREPDGAFYVFADARRFGLDSRALAFDLLERAHVAITPGVDFGASGEGWLRFSYACSEADITEALRRLRAALG